MHFLWVDDPYLRGTYSEVLGHKPPPDERLKFEALLAWAQDGYDNVEAAIFINVPDNRQQQLTMYSWINWLKSVGYRVWARPKQGNDGDIDEAMVATLNDAVSMPADDHVVTVVSGDASRWLEYLEELSDSVVLVRAVGFIENSSGLSHSDKISFYDVQDIPGFVPVDLPDRVRLDRLPAEGAWL